MSGKIVCIDKDILRDLSTPRVFPWLIGLAQDWLVLFVAFGLVAYDANPFTIFFSILIVGNRQHALAILGHEGTHGRIAKRRKLNDLLSNLFCFWWLGLTASGYRNLHNRHHRNTGTIDDPELGHKRSRSPQWDLPARPTRILKYAIADLFGFSLPDYYIIVTYSKPEKRADYLPMILIHAIFISSAMAFSLWWVPAIWYLSLTTSFMMFFRLRLWLEHQGSPSTHRLHLSFIEGCLLAPHNIWYHWEHHKYSHVPFHQLPKVRRLETSVAIMSLSDLLKFFSNATPSRSGQVNEFI